MPTAARIIEHGKAVVDVANAIKSAYVLAKEVSNFNAVNDPDWNNLHANPVDPPVDTATKIIDETQVTPQDISNAIGSINMFLAYWEGQAVATSAYGQNLEKLAKPIV